ncbi:MAG: hypothetical protein K2W95_25440 [Candidatus Obscuribacterales bacterium]|nr:hypothetical protein [Candidatus Obscuribacterales bacterium]
MITTILACLLAGAFSGFIGHAISAYYWRRVEISHWENSRVGLLAVFAGAVIGALAVSLVGNVVGCSMGLPLLSSLICGSIGGYAALFQWGN